MLRRIICSALLALLALFCLPDAASASEGDAAIDQVWGQFAKLPGRSANAGPTGYVMRWSWRIPGKELVQEYVNPGSDKVDHREVITPGPVPGSLVLVSSALGKKQWNGTLQPDGRVLFIGKGLLKLPYVAGFGDTGAWEIRRADVDGERIVSLDEPTQYTRFELDEVPTVVLAAEAGEAAAKPEGAALAGAGPVTASGASMANGDPAPGVAPMPPPAAPVATNRADFGVMGQFVGQQFVHRNALGSVLLVDGGQTLVLQFGNLVYHLRATERPDRYEVVQHSHGVSPKAQRLRNGAIEISYSTRSIDDMIGTRHRVRFGKGEQGGVSLFAEYHSIAALLAGWDFAWAQDYRPYSATTVAEERQYAQWDREDSADRARRRAAQQAEIDAAWQRGIANMTGSLDEYASREQQRRDESQAVLDGINARARVEAEAQRRAAQQDGLDRAARQQAAQQQSVARQDQSPVSASPAGTTRYSAVPGPGTGSWEGAGARSSGSQASTRDDTSQCVAPPVTSTHQCGALSGYKALVVNNCTAPVDLRVCFMTDAGWNCQRSNGVTPGDDWEPGWCHANTGQVFLSSRYSDSKENLESP